MRQALEHLAWQLSGLPQMRVAVNLSAYQFQQQKLPEFVAGLLLETGQDASCLELELTERFAASNYFKE